jgi:hypothetical protein
LILSILVVTVASPGVILSPELAQRGKVHLLRHKPADLGIRLDKHGILANIGLLFYVQIVAVLGCLSVAAWARPQEQTPIPILKYENEGVNYDGSYKWRLVSS